jgi:hypothetical protein
MYGEGTWRRITRQTIETKVKGSGNDMNAILQMLLLSPEPSIRYKVRARVIGEAEDSTSLLALRQEIKQSERVRALLAERDEVGRILPVDHPYHKWRGAHWVLASLADIGYPAGEVELLPVSDQVLDCWLGEQYIREYPAEKASKSDRSRGVPVILGRARRCASQQGNALYATLALGLADERCDRLAAMLMRWQWPDGGWNCDRKPEADSSSFYESLIPLRALALYAKVSGDVRARIASEAAAEVFLKRRLFRRLADGSVMNTEFLSLHYPCYWHYDILFALKVMAEAGFIGDPRCSEALDRLEAKSLPGGGWPAEFKFYTLNGNGAHTEHVSWGGTGKRKMNEWVTVDVLFVLKAAGRLPGL